MARTVSVKLDLDASGFLAGLGKGAAATQAFASNLSASITKNDQHIRTLSTGVGLLGVAVGAGVGVAVKSFADFDAAMSSVAATGQDARNNLSGLREAAIQAGADTKYSASEAAGGLEALAKAGVSAKDQLGGGLTGALSLAAAGNQTVAESAETAASAMSQFGLSGKDVPHIADLLAQAAGTAQGEVSDMAAALNQGGLVANQFGLSIEETAQSLALFAKNGLLGSDAGTSFKTMLTSLYAPAGAGAQALAKLGVSAYDASGKIKPIGAVLDQLKGQLDGLTEKDRNRVMRDIFGSDAIRAGTILLKDGSAGLRQMADEFGNFGSAADVARIKMDNLSGDLEQLGGSFETALIGLGEGANGPLRVLVQGATEGVNAFNDLGSRTKSALLAVGGGLAALAVGAAGLGKLVVFVNEAKTALSALGATAKGTTIAVAGVGAVIGVAALAFGAYASNAAESRARVDDFTTALQSQTDAIEANVTAVAAKQLSDSGALAAARNLGLSLDDVTQAALGNADALERVNTATQAIFEQGLNSNDTDMLQRVADARLLSDAVRQTGGEYSKAVQGAQDFAAASGHAADSAQPDAYKETGDALDAMVQDSQNAKAALDALVDSLFAAGNAAVGLSNAAIGYEQAVDAAAEAAKKNGRNLDIATAAGRANRTALNQLASSSQRYVESLVEQGASTKRVASATSDARASFIKAATSMGLSATAAKALADKYGLIPKDVKTKVSAPGATTSKHQTDDFFTALKKLPDDVRSRILSIFNNSGITAARAALNAIDGTTAKTYVTTVYTKQYAAAQQRAGRGAFAYGGQVPGYSPNPRADNIDASLTAGEYVHDVPAVRYWGTDFMDAVLAQNRAAVANLVRGYAYGGLVGPMAAPGSYAASYGSGDYSGRPITVQQFFPTSASPMAAAQAAGGRVSDVLSAAGV